MLIIASKYAKRIRKGTKKWEFRKCKLKYYNNIYLYERKPIQKVTLLLNVSEYIEDTPDNIWNKCKDNAGITENEFKKYFKNRKIAYAYKIDNFKEINIDLKQYNIVPSQCVLYIDKIET